MGASSTFAHAPLSRSKISSKLIIPFNLRKKARLDADTALSFYSFPRSAAYLALVIIFGTSILSLLLSGHKHYLDLPLTPHLTRDFQVSFFSFSFSSSSSSSFSYIFISEFFYQLLAAC
jgi:hypothetical protein